MNNEYYLCKKCNTQQVGFDSNSNDEHKGYCYICFVESKIPDHIPKEQWSKYMDKKYGN